MNDGLNNDRKLTSEILRELRFKIEQLIVSDY